MDKLSDCVLNLNILDCTFRDGGYYTNWDFDDTVIDEYVKGMNSLPVNYLELGYRNKPSGEYMGKLGYSPVSVLRKIREKSEKKLAIMLNEKSTVPDDLDYLLSPLAGIIDMVRLAVDPENFERARLLACEIKKMGFEVAFNTMYMSKWKDYEGFLDNLGTLNGVADLFVMVDSFGGILPEEVKEITGLVKSKLDCHVGFHGHNNLQLALINTLTAIESGADFVDATILGMGRGAGNLNTELLLTLLGKKGLRVNFNVLGDILQAFKPLSDIYGWGTNLPYMISGANSMPQKEVMDWVANRTYSFNSIVRALDNKRNKLIDNAHYPIWKAGPSEKALIIGGGKTVIEHCSAIHELLSNYPEITVIFATTKHANLFKDISNRKIYCLVGNESKRMKQKISADEFDGICVLPPYPRTMGTEVPCYAENHTFELPEIAFTKNYLDSCTTTALKVAIEMKSSTIYFAGYDGYRGSVLSEKEAILTIENRTLFDDFKRHTGKELISLTPTLYQALTVKSIYLLL